MYERLRVSVSKQQQNGWCSLSLLSNKSLAREYLYGARYEEIFAKEVVDEEEDTRNGSYCDI